MPVYTLLDDMETPPLVRAMLRRFEPLSLPPAQMKSFEREFKLSYYFGGINVVADRTVKGLPLYASGTEEQIQEDLRAITDHLPPHPLLWLTPEPIEDILPHLPKPVSVSAPVATNG